MHLLLRLYIYLHLPRLCCKTTHLVCFIYIYGVSAATAALRLLKNDSFTKEPPAAKLSICTYGSTPAGKLFISCIYSSVATPLHSSAFTSPLLLLKNDSSLIYIVVPKRFICILYVYTTVYVVVPKRLRRISLTAVLPEKDASAPTAVLPEKDAPTSTPRHGNDAVAQQGSPSIGLVKITHS